MGVHNDVGVGDNILHDKEANRIFDKEKVRDERCSKIVEWVADNEGNRYQCIRFAGELYFWRGRDKKLVSGRIVATKGGVKQYIKGFQEWVFTEVLLSDAGQQGL